MPIIIREYDEKLTSLYSPLLCPFILKFEAKYIYDIGKIDNVNVDCKEGISNSLSK